VKRFTIPANPKRRFLVAITVVLGDDLDQEYTVAEKDFPAGLPVSWIDPDVDQAKAITWISNFGLKRAGGSFVMELPEGQTYQVELPLISGKYVYFDGKSVQKLTGWSTAAGFVAELALGDPPIGSST